LDDTVGVEDAFDFEGVLEEADEVGAHNEKVLNWARPFYFVELVVVDSLDIHVEGVVTLGDYEGLDRLIEDNLGHRVCRMVEQRVDTGNRFSLFFTLAFNSYVF